MGDDHSSPGDVGASLTGALAGIIERLRQPPLLFALGVLIVLAIVAAVSVEGLRLLWIPALALAVLALVAWLVQVLGTRRDRRTGTRVRLRAEDVGETGVVKGIEGLPLDGAADLDVDMKATNIRGRTTGISGWRGRKK